MQSLTSFVITLCSEETMTCGSCNSDQSCTALGRGGYKIIGIIRGYIKFYKTRMLCICSRNYFVMKHCREAKDLIEFNKAPI